MTRAEEKAREIVRGVFGRDKLGWTQEAIEEFVLKALEGPSEDDIEKAAIEYEPLDMEDHRDVFKEGANFVKNWGKNEWL